MNLTLQDLLTILKDSAVSAGFETVKEKKINTKDYSDTLLPAMLIVCNSISYEKLLMKSVQEKYELQIFIVIGDTDNPITNLKDLQDEFLNIFFSNSQIQELLEAGRFELIRSVISNDEKVYQQYGGQSTILSCSCDLSNCFI
jgi:hypothetical protein